MTLLDTLQSSSIARPVGDGARPERQQLRHQPR